MDVLISERANQSIQQLSGALEQLNPDGEDVRRSEGNLFTMVDEEDKDAWSQKTHSEAGNTVLIVYMFPSSESKYLFQYVLLSFLAS